MKNDIGKKLLSLMYMEIVIEREGGLELEGDLERLEELYGMEVKNKVGKMRPDVDCTNVIQNAKFHA